MRMSRKSGSKLWCLGSWLWRPGSMLWCLGDISRPRPEVHGAELWAELTGSSRRGGPKRRPQSFPEEVREFSRDRVSEGWAAWVCSWWRSIASCPIPWIVRACPRIMSLCSRIIRCIRNIMSCIPKWCWSGGGPACGCMGRECGEYWTIMGSLAHGSRC